VSELTAVKEMFIFNGYVISECWISIVSCISLEICDQKKELKSLVTYNETCAGC